MAKLEECCIASADTVCNGCFTQESESWPMGLLVVFFYIYILEKIRLGISCELSAGQMIRSSICQKLLMTSAADKIITVSCTRFTK